MVDRIIQVRHPATIRRADDDGTGRGVSWLACSTPVRLRERDPSAFQLVQRHAGSSLDMPYEVYAGDGRLWGRLDGRSPFAPDEPGVQVEHLVAFLEGRPCGEAQALELGWAFGGTPVLAIDGHDEQRGRAIARRPRADPVDLERAAAEVIAFVDGGVAISGGRVMVGGPGLLLTRHPVTYAHHRDSEWSLLPWRGLRPSPSRTYRPIDLAEAVAFECGATGDANVPAGVLRGLWLEDGYEAGDGGIVETVNEVPRTIHAMVRRRLLGRLPAAEREELAQADGGILADAMRRLGPWYAKATTGAIALDDATAAIAAWAGVVDALGAVVPHDRARLGLDELEIAFRCFSERMEPRIHTRVDAGNEADMASLAALA